MVINYGTQMVSPYMLPEKFFPAGEGSLSLDTLFAEAQALWNVRGYPSGKISVIEGMPYGLTDITRGQLVFYVYEGQLYIDYIENIEILDNRTMFNKITYQIGDGKSEEAAATKAQRKMVEFETFKNIILSGGDPQQ